MYESWRHAEWKTGADTTVRTDRVGHRRRQLLKLLPADVYHEILEAMADWELELQRSMQASMVEGHSDRAETLRQNSETKRLV
jgi:hypothetical protein